jgi:hypothetical protein
MWFCLEFWSVVFAPCQQNYQESKMSCLRQKNKKRVFVIRITDRVSCITPTGFRRLQMGRWSYSRHRNIPNRGPTLAKQQHVVFCPPRIRGFLVARNCVFKLELGHWAGQRLEVTCPLCQENYSMICLEESRLVVVSGIRFEC